MDEGYLSLMFVAVCISMGATAASAVKNHWAGDDSRTAVVMESG